MGGWRTLSDGRRVWMASAFPDEELHDEYCTLRNKSIDTSLYSSYVNPNASCPVCGDRVFYYKNTHGSSVFFDELGPPWPKHPCTDANGRYGNFSSVAVKVTDRDYKWKLEKWEPISIDKVKRLSSGMEIHVRFVRSREVCRMIAGKSISALGGVDNLLESIIFFRSLDAKDRAKLNIYSTAVGEMEILVATLGKPEEI